MKTTNVSTVELADGRSVCLSYGVPVAVFVPGRGYLKTAAWYSVTTSRHANQFCEGRGVDVPAEEFATLIAPLAVPR